jgi:hypothetical protein
VALGSDPTIAAALIGAIAAHAGIAAEVVMRPLLGVALVLPAHADAQEVARALDAEQVTAGYLDFQGRACVALPAHLAHVEQLAHSVAKVVHLLLEIHTGFINVQSDACPLPDLADVDAETAASAVLDGIGALAAVLADWRRVDEQPDDLRGMVAEGLELLRALCATGDGSS